MQPAFLLKDSTKIANYADTPIFPKKFRPPDGGIKTPRRHRQHQILGIQKFKERRLFSWGFAPFSFFSFYPICGSSSKKQRGDE
jgi:hypothetical protein